MKLAKYTSPVSLLRVRLSVKAVRTLACERIFLFLVLVGLPLAAAAQDGSYDVQANGADPTGTKDSTTAVQTTINNAGAAGGGIVYFPPGTYVVAGAHPASNVTLRGAGAASVLKNNSGTHIIDGTASGSLTYHDFVVEDLTFIGTVPVPSPIIGPINQGAKGSPGNGADVGVWIEGSLDMADGSFNPVTNITIRRCNFRNLSGAPIKMLGISGKAIVLDSEFYNSADPGWVYDQEVICSNSHSYLSGDNGFSFSRGNRKMTITNNTSELAAQAGMYLGGYNGQLAADDFTVTGNTIISPGGVGISLLDAPMRGTISGNTINKNGIRGTVDSPDDVWQWGIMVRGEPPSGPGINSPTAFATYLNITGNTIYEASRGGIYLQACKGVLVSNNVIGDTGTPTDSRGNPISPTDPTENVGILADRTSTISNLFVFNNVMLDQRSTPLMNYGLYPSQSTFPSSAGTAVNNYANVTRSGVY